MNDFSKLDSKLEKKKAQVNRLEEEIKEIQNKIQEEKEASIIKTLRKVSLSTAEYENLSRAIQDKTVIKFLEIKYEAQKTKEEKKGE